jgi:hypothetical protein
MECESLLQSMVDKLGSIINLLQEIKEQSTNSTMDEMASDIKALKELIVGGD